MKAKFLIPLVAMAFCSCVTYVDRPRRWHHHHYRSYHSCNSDADLVLSAIELAATLTELAIDH